MRSIGVQSRVFSFVIVVVLLQFPSTLAGTPDAELAMAEGSRVPNRPSTEAATHNDRGPVEVTFTKWVTTFPLMQGFTGGDLAGDFVGEILQRQVSVNPNLLNGIIRLEAIYEVHAADRSFTALIRGGTNAVTGEAILDGVVLAGWRTGARVHVEFETIPGTTGCVGAPAGLTCFQGTIHVGRAPKD
jgi:hypothetical protein